MRGLVVVLGLVVSLGCGTQPAPRIAVFGTTITFLIPQLFPKGFGRHIGRNFGGDPTAASANAYNDSNLLEDPQRGELIFRAVYAANDSKAVYLPVRWMTRVSFDESSPAANDSQDLFSLGQVVAFVDIPEKPAGFEDGLYNVEVSLWRRNTSGTGFEHVPVTIESNGTKDWLGWGTADPSVGIPLWIQERSAVVANDSMVTELLAWAGAGSPLSYHQNVPITDSDLDQVVPHPRMTVLVPDPAEDEEPAAWEMTLNYASQKLGIRGVSLRSNQESSAIITFADQPGSPGGCADKAGTLTLQAAAPGPVMQGARIAFDLLDFVGCGRASAADFEVSSVKLYDENGATIDASHKLGDPD